MGFPCSAEHMYLQRNKAMAFLFYLNYLAHCSVKRSIVTGQVLEGLVIWCAMVGAAILKQFGIQVLAEQKKTDFLTSSPLNVPLIQNNLLENSVEIMRSFGSKLLNKYNQCRTICLATYGLLIPPKTVRQTDSFTSMWRTCAREGDLLFF
jgi:hypothetical protein